MPVGLDTSILIYALDSTAGKKHRTAVKIVADVLRNPTDYLVSTQVLGETLYVVKKKRVGDIWQPDWSSHSYKGSPQSPTHSSKYSKPSTRQPAISGTGSWPTRT